MKNRIIEKILTVVSIASLLGGAILYMDTLVQCDKNMDKYSNMSSDIITYYEVSGNYDGTIFTCYSDERPSIDGQMFEFELDEIGYHVIEMSDNGTPADYTDDFMVRR